MEDHDVLAHISELVEEERVLRSNAAAGVGLSTDARGRMARLEVQLDQYWDLLRRRYAREEYGQNPDEEAPRDPAVVEGYEQ
jgi:hypothetical protein